MNISRLDTYANLPIRKCCSNSPAHLVRPGRGIGLPCAVLAELEQRVGSVPASVLCLIRPVPRGIVQIEFTAGSQTARSHLRRERYASGPCRAGRLRAGMPNRL